MKAALYEDFEKIVLKDVDAVKPPPGYVVVDTKCSGICGSDLHNYYGEWSQSHTHAQGHEVAGLVAEVGEGVEGFRPGDKVTMECFSHDGTCDFCSRGQYNHCTGREWFSGDGHGGFAEFTMMHASSLFRLPDTFTYEEGALIEPLAVAHRAVMQSGATHRDRVLVMGGGNDSLSCVRKRGTVVLVAGYFEPLEVDLGKIVWSEAVVTGSNCYAYSGREKDFDAAIELIASGKVDATKIVSHRLPLAEVVEAFRIAADKSSGSVKIHVVQE
jgi:threonine dehydrogenase-like Zn-dependent dehydrogenase